MGSHYCTAVPARLFSEPAERPPQSIPPQHRSPRRHPASVLESNSRAMARTQLLPTTPQGQPVCFSRALPGRACNRASPPPGRCQDHRCSNASRWRGFWSHARLSRLQSAPEASQYRFPSLLIITLSLDGCAAWARIFLIVLPRCPVSIQLPIVWRTRRGHGSCLVDRAVA